MHSYYAFFIMYSSNRYAFIRFSSKESACSAICGVHGMEINGSIAKCSWGKENIDMNAGGGGSGNQSSGVASGLGMGSSLYGNASSSAASLAALAAAQNANSLSQLGGSTAASNPWNSANAANSTQNTANWAAANYQWAAGYPQNTMNYWQGAYPGAYQNAAMMQGWGVMPTATAAGNTGSSAQYQLGQYQQGTNGKS